MSVGTGEKLELRNVCRKFRVVKDLKLYGGKIIPEGTILKLVDILSTGKLVFGRENHRDSDILFPPEMAREYLGMIE